MSRRVIFSIIFSIALGIPSSVGIAFAAGEFSADILITPNGEESMKGKIFVKEGKVRQETVEEEEPQIMIIRLDRKIAWVLSPEEKTYTEMSYRPVNKTFEEWTAEKQKNAKFLGEETVSGLRCKKYSTMEDGEKTVLWVSDQFPFPIKIEDSEMKMEYQNIKLGPLNDSLFEIPEGYHQASPR